MICSRFKLCYQFSASVDTLLYFSGELFFCHSLFANLLYAHVALWPHVVRVIFPTWHSSVNIFCRLLIGSSYWFCVLNCLALFLILIKFFTFPSPPNCPPTVCILKAEKDFLSVNYLAYVHLFSFCLKNYLSPHTLCDNIETYSDWWERWRTRLES